MVISSLDKHDLINLEGTFQENCNGRCIRYPTFFVSELCFTSDRTELHFIADGGICSVHLTSILVLAGGGWVGGGSSSCAASWGPRPDLHQRISVEDTDVLLMIGRVNTAIHLLAVLHLHTFHKVLKYQLRLCR